MNVLGRVGWRGGSGRVDVSVQVGCRGRLGWSGRVWWKDQVGSGRVEGSVRVIQSDGRVFDGRVGSGGGSFSSGRMEGLVRVVRSDRGGGSGRVLVEGSVRVGSR